MHWTSGVDRSSGHTLNGIPANGEFPPAGIVPRQYLVTSWERSAVYCEDVQLKRPSLSMGMVRQR